MGGGPHDMCEAQHRWGQRALSTSRTQQAACQDQWELIIENGNSQARAIEELRRELELVRGEVGAQRGEISGCSGSVARLDRLMTQHTQRMIDESQADMESGLAHLEKKCQAEFKMLEDQIMGIVDAKLKQHQELWLAQERDGPSSSEVWAGIKKEQYSHEVYIQETLRRFGATAKEQDARALAVQEHLDRLEKELRAFMKEHDTGVVNGKEELSRFCTAIKAGLDARVTCLHERVGDFEKGLDAHVDWVQGELRQLHSREAQGASFRESAIRVEKELDMHVDWVQGELGRLSAAIQAAECQRGDVRECEARFAHELNSHMDRVNAELRQITAAVKVEQDSRAIHSRDWAGRLEEQLDSVKGELRHMSASLREEQGELRRFDAKLEAQQEAQRVERQEEGRRFSRLEGLLGDVDSRVVRLQDDLRGHWHKLSVTEHVQCGPAEPPTGTVICRTEADVGEPEPQRSPERTWQATPEARRADAEAALDRASFAAEFGAAAAWQALAPERRGDAGARADDDVVISGSALFGSSPGRTEMPSMIESVEG